MCITSGDIDRRRMLRPEPMAVFVFYAILDRAAVPLLASIRILQSGLMLIIWWTTAGSFLYRKKRVRLKCHVYLVGLGVRCSAATKAASD